MFHHQSKYLAALCCAILFAALLTPQLAPAATHPQLASAPPPIDLDDAPFGLNTHLATRHPDVQTMDVPAELIKQAGVGWAREDIHWWRVQPTPDVWDWSHTDAAFRALIQRDVEIVAVLGHPPGWSTRYTNDTSYDISFYPPEPQQFAVFAREAVKRYGQYVKHWEIWNEPDNVLFWKPNPDPSAYAQLLMTTAVTIRSVDPAAQILIGGLNPFDNDFLKRVAEAGAWSSFDILALHPYINPAEPEAGNISASTDAARALAERYGAKPIWVTEVGWSSGPGDRDTVGFASTQDQAHYLVRSTLLLWQAGVERIFWYTLKDDFNNPYGLVTFGGGRHDYAVLKPSYHALRTMSEQLRNAKFMGSRDLFTRRTVFDFETLGVWRRGDQPNGDLRPTANLQFSGRSSAELTYDFPSNGNDFVVFVRDTPLAIPDGTYALEVWVYGDGSGNTLKVWLRDAEGERLQYALGAVGPAGWQLLQAPIGRPVAEWDRISKGGNGKLDFPAGVYALTLDDAPQTFIGRGTIYLDEMTAISGPEGYNIQLQRGDTLIDVLWAPEGVRARLPVNALTATIVDQTGATNTVYTQDSFVTLDLGPAPVYVQHAR
jgi:hypothetical protein